VRGGPAFPSVPTLGSTRSATGAPALFASFFATMAESDFSDPFIIGYGSSPSRCGPVPYRGWSDPRSPGSRTRNVRTCQVRRPRRLGGALTLAHSLVLPSATHTASAPKTVFYRGSMAGLYVPLPTLRRHPHECLRTARGRCGSLHLHRSGLAPPIPCRSSGASCVKTQNRVFRTCSLAKSEFVSAVKLASTSDRASFAARFAADGSMLATFHTAWTRSRH
jgi:hypothetical protein